MTSVKNFRDMSHSINKSEEGVGIMAKNEELMDLLDGYEASVYNIWAAEVERKMVEGLNR